MGNKTDILEIELIDEDVLGIDMTAEDVFDVELLNDPNAASTKDYNKLINKPSVNNITLEGNKTFEELGQTDISNVRIKEIIDDAFNLIF